MKILVLGDTHAEFNKINTLINKKHPDLILQCGDFDYWPAMDDKYELGNKRVDSQGRIIKRSKWRQCGIKNGKTKINFCDGNHEDHWSLKKLKSNEICPNIFYMKRGACLTLADGRNVLFLGGAESTDKESRELGRDWFPEEIITANDIENLPDKKIDIVISHTCPKEFSGNLPQHNEQKFTDPSMDTLSYVLNRYRPSLWYFAHFHLFKTGVINDVRWTALNMASQTGWFAKLPSPFLVP